MSGLASIYNVPQNDNDRNTWAFDHMAHHRDINRRLYELTGVALPEFVLDPVDPDNAGTWESQHQQMHDNQNQLLGIKGNDLSEINWRDPRLLAGWVFLNASEHFQASNILEIG